MSYTIERKRSDCSALPKGWQREEVTRKTGLSAGKVDVFYYSPMGLRVDTKSKLMRQLGSTLDLSAFDFQLGKHSPNATLFLPLQPTGQSPSSAGHYHHQNQQQQHQQQHPQHHNQRIAKRSASTAGMDALPLAAASPVTNAQLKHPFDYRNARNDVALVPPIRQTASIFKQPVTVYKTQESIMKSDLKHGAMQEKPKQLFWEKRLERMRACDYDGVEFSSVSLPKSLRPVGPCVDDDTLLQSVATALHVTAGSPVVGQTASRQMLNANPAVFLNPEQPLMHAVDVSDDDIRKQEDRVGNARKKLQEFLKVQ